MYLAEMINLQTDHPGVHQGLIAGPLSVQLCEGSIFVCLSVDQTTEVTINKDTKQLVESAQIYGSVEPNNFP